MDFQGKVLQFLGETTGTSKAGNPWKKKEWVVETLGQYPRKIKVQCFGDRSDAINLIENHIYTLYVDLESREFNGRWYTDVSVYRIEENGGNSGHVGGGLEPGPVMGNISLGNQQPQNFTPSESEEDLPF